MSFDQNTVKHNVENLILMNTKNHNIARLLNERKTSINISLQTLQKYTVFKKQINVSIEIQYDYSNLKKISKFKRIILI